MKSAKSNIDYKKIMALKCAAIKSVKDSISGKKVQNAQK
jgi:hypothetical protein